LHGGLTLLALCALDGLVDDTTGLLLRRADLTLGHGLAPVIAHSDANASANDQSHQHRNHNNNNVYVHECSHTSLFLDFLQQKAKIRREAPTGHTTII